MSLFVKNRIFIIVIRYCKIVFFFICFIHIIKTSNLHYMMGFNSNCFGIQFGTVIFINVSYYIRTFFCTVSKFNIFLIRNKIDICNCR